MKKWIALLLTFALMVSLCGVTALAEAAGTTTEEAVSTTEAQLFPQEDITDLLNAVDTDYAYQLAVTLSTDTRFHDNELGFRTAGSDAEHAAADWLVEQMEDLGLSDIEKVPVDVDKWQFNGASLTIAGTDIDIMPVSYQVSGTDADGITAELVDVGTGFAADYEGLDVEGKIVIAGVDQYNEAWIDQYMYEAALHGAAALITYDIGGYGRYSDDVYQIQDVCCEDLLPTVIVSVNQYKEIAAALEAGNTEATLTVDSELGIGTGTSYNVIGVLKGRSSDQQIIVSGHYDMYFTGFQDDCCAIAAAFGIVKAMKDSGYVPENDIVLVCHGAEEWGISGTEFDWTRGAWEMINTVHPEWAEKTIAMFNFELPAFMEEGATTFGVSCVPEFAPLVEELVANTDLLEGSVSDVFTDGIDSISVDTTTMEDGVSYREAGVPYFINVTSTCAGTDSVFEETWTGMHYHTDSDDVTTYSEDMMAANIGVFGAIAVYIDSMPALNLDLTATCDDLEEAYHEETAEAAGVDGEAYLAAVDELREAAEDLTARVNDINSRYAQALADGAAQDELDAIRAEGTALNQTTLEAFRFVQQHLIGIEFSSDIVIRHVGYQDNAEIIAAVIAALEEGDLSDDDGTGALDLVWMLNGVVEYGYYLFSPDAVAGVAAHTDAAQGNAKLWGTDMGYEFAETWPATVSLLEKAETEDADFTDEIELYTTELEAQLKLMAEDMAQETADMAELTAILEK